MPKDLKGTPLEVGDLVTLQGTVTDLGEGENYGDATIELVVPIDADGNKVGFAITPNQAEKFVAIPAAPEPPKE